MVAACGQALPSADTSEDAPVRLVDAGVAEDSARPTSETCATTLPCEGTDVAEDFTSPPAALCLEACVKLAWDPNGFGDGGTDYVKILDVAIVGETERAAGFNVGLAAMPYFFADGLGDITVVQWPAGFPRDRWFHLHVDVHYDDAPRMELFIDGERIAGAAVPAYRVVPTYAALTRGPIASGVHPTVDIRFGVVRLARR